MSENETNLHRGLLYKCRYCLQEFFHFEDWDEHNCEKMPSNQKVIR